MVSASDANLQQRLSLYRGLLSLIEAPRSEEELIRFVVDSIHDHFLEYRTAFSWMNPEGVGRVVYSREEPAQVSMTGKEFDLSSAPWFVRSLREGNSSVIRDVRENSALSRYAEPLQAIGANLSRLDIPILDAEGNVGVFSLSSAKPVDWSEETVKLLREVSELTGLMIREARAQERLHRSETLFRQFADNVKVVFWMSDLAKREMVYVSPSYETIWGRSMESLYREPRSFIDAIHPEDRDRVAAAVARQGEAPYEQIYRVVQPGGNVRWVKDRGFVVRDERGLAYRVCGIAEDVTPLREAEDRLEATQAQVISNAKFAALGEMASGIAHEINNPLAVIHGLTVQMQELFRKQSASTPMVLDGLESMEKMANRIAAIVKGLRTFSRQTDGDPMTPADINLIVQETMALCEAKLRAANIRVSVKLPPSRVMVRCRSSEISQVILNLLSNAYDAVHATRDRAITLVAEAADGIARLSVEDSGPGIDPSHRDRIFQPFYTTKEVGRGTGLGLSISKGIIEAHGGKLFLDEGAQRTRFVVELPSVNR